MLSTSAGVTEKCLSQVLCFASVLSFRCNRLSLFRRN